MDEYSLGAYRYDLPKEMIAQEPLADRAASKLLLLDRASGAVSHDVFRNLPGLIEPGSVLALNDTRVFPARCYGRRRTGGLVEMVFCRELAPSRWLALMSAKGKLALGETVSVAEGRMLCRIVEDRGLEGRILQVECREGVMDVLRSVGRAPLPPYIKRPAGPGDLARYQTVYAAREGSCAAPTAGLHFTPRLLERLRERGVECAFVTLHVGPGTFRPVQADDIRAHRVAPEVYEVSPEAAERINRAMDSGRRVIAVGTTSARALEASCDGAGRAAAGGGETDLFIYPGFRFKVVGGLVTNFHLPGSSLIMLAAALAGRERLLAAYEGAKRAGYRFYSYGDAMLIL